MIALLDTYKFGREEKDFDHKFTKTKVISVYSYFCNADCNVMEL